MPGRRSILVKVALGIAGLVTVLVAASLFMDWDLFKGPIARAVSARTGRSVSIAGPLQVHLWSRTPTLSVEGVRVANPPWEVPRPLLQLQRLQVQIELRPLFTGHLILRRLEVDRPDLYLHQESSGRANWTDANTAPTSAARRAAQPFNLPAIHELIIQSGTLVLNDDARRLRITGSIDAHEHSAVADPHALHILAQGTINTQPFMLEVSGGALLAVNPEHPYPFKLSIRAAENQIEAAGRILKPFDLGQVQLQVGDSHTAASLPIRAPQRRRVGGTRTVSLPAGGTPGNAIPSERLRRSVPCDRTMVDLHPREGNRRARSSSGALHRGGVAPPERLPPQASQGRLFQPRYRWP